jgi:GNAT superfamily N-acetyltransferase
MAPARPPEAGPAPQAPAPPDEVVLEERPPSPADLRRLYDAVDWRGELPVDDGQLAAALGRSLYAVCAVAGGTVVGCARVLGDGAVHLYVEDVIVTPAWQGHGLGDRLMTAVMGWLDARCPGNALVVLSAAPGVDPFYVRYGFGRVPADEPGMALRWTGPGCWRRGAGMPA